MSYANKTLTCRDCGTEFVFTAGEQEFYAQKGFTNEPLRCPSCRQQRKAAANRGGGGYGERDNFGSGGFGGGRRSSGGGYGGRAGGEREMHTVQCANCGKDAQVPFVPRGDKPVYCDDCFRERRAARW
jgi:CxxC-x17-CxxC domain-containing protein